MAAIHFKKIWKAAAEKDIGGKQVTIQKNACYLTRRFKQDVLLQKILQWVMCFL